MNCLTWWIDLLLARRLIISFVTSIVIALGVYYVGGETPALAAVAFFIGLVGLCVGLIWHIAGGKSGAT